MHIHTLQCIKTTSLCNLKMSFSTICKIWWVRVFVDPCHTFGCIKCSLSLPTFSIEVSSKATSLFYPINVTRISDQFYFVIINLCIIYIFTYLSASEDSFFQKMRKLSPNWWQGFNSAFLSCVIMRLSPSQLLFVIL